MLVSCKKNTALMLIFDQKNVCSLQSTVLLCYFFCDFAQKISALMAIFCQKRSFSKKHTVFSCPYFGKNHTALMLIFCQKNVYSLKSTVLSWFFFQIFMGNPLLSYARIWSKNVNSVKTTLNRLWAK